MSDQWQHQVRLYLADELAEIARRNPNDPALASLPEVLAKHQRRHEVSIRCLRGLRCRGGSSGDYGYPLYAWTKATIEDPVKRAKQSSPSLSRSTGEKFTPKVEADALEAELRPLVDGTRLPDLSRHDTNPAKNPQPPNAFASQG